MIPLKGLYINVQSIHVLITLFLAICERIKKCEKLDLPLLDFLVVFFLSFTVLYVHVHAKDLEI